MTARSTIITDPRQRLRATVIVMFGGFMSIFTIAIVNISLPEIMTALATNIERIKWVITAYMISLCVLMPTIGWLAGRFGHRNLFIASLALFTFASFCCGMSWSVESLVFFRVIQGVGGGLLMPITMALLLRIFPSHQHGMAMGIWGLANSIGGSLGPTVGGIITECFSWRYIFLINVIPGVAGVLLSVTVLPPDEDREPAGLDLPGFLTMAVAMVSLLVALSQGQLEGWKSIYIMRLFAIFAVAFATFLVVELCTKQPLIDLSLYRNLYYALATVLSLVIGFGLYSSAFLVPIFMVKLLDYSTLQAALAWLPGAAVVIVVAQLSGRLSDYTDARIPLVTGLLMWTFFVHLFAGLDLRTSYAAVLMVIFSRGLGLGMTLPPMNTLAVSAVPPRRVTMATGLISLTMSLGGMFGIALMGSVLERRELLHLAGYAQWQEWSSVATVDVLDSLQTALERSGYVEVLAERLALVRLANAIGQEALASAFQDCFHYLSAAFLSALVPALMLKRVYWSREM